MSPEKAYFKWRSEEKVGCMFARMMSIDPTRHGQVVKVLKGGRPADNLAHRIEKTIGSLVSNPDVAAVAILLPDVTELADLTNVAVSLKSQPLWSVSTSEISMPTVGEMVAFHIIKMIPFGQALCPSEALILGPFQEFPVTRRAPITAMEIFVGEPRSADPKTGEPTKKANLAHVVIPQLEDTPHIKERIWKKV